MHRWTVFSHMFVRTAVVIFFCDKLGGEWTGSQLNLVRNNSMQNELPFHLF